MAANTPTLTLRSSCFSFDDYDVSGSDAIHRVCIPHSIKFGEQFNAYGPDSRKIGIPWQGSAAASVKSYLGRSDVSVNKYPNLIVPTDFLRGPALNFAVETALGEDTDKASELFDHGHGVYMPGLLKGIEIFVREASIDRTMFGCEVEYPAFAAHVRRAKKLPNQNKDDHFTLPNEATAVGATQNEAFLRAWLSLQGLEGVLIPERHIDAFAKHAPVTMGYAEKGDPALWAGSLYEMRWDTNEFKWFPAMSQVATRTARSGLMPQPLIYSHYKTSAIEQNAALACEDIRLLRLIALSVKHHSDDTLTEPFRHFPAGTDFSEVEAWFQQANPNYETPSCTIAMRPQGA